MRCSRRGVAHSLSLFSLLLVLAGSAACDAEPDEIPDDESCKQAGYAIANRTFTCEGDGDLANERYERLMDEYRCLANDGFGCAEKTLELTCEQVADAGDDLDRWLTLASCGLFESRTVNSREAGVHE